MQTQYDNQNEQNRLKPLPAVLVTLLVLVLAFIPFIKNYKDNDNHLNWLNHDYGKNLMMSTEENSLLMTEGGDNQVFATLYFTYAEKLRPDLTPYDQKGNIFNKIYGDMRYIDINTLKRRMDLVDAHLFSSEEPFYKDIRSREDPYFVPYWQVNRPVYLTWKKPNITRLKIDSYDMVYNAGTTNIMNHRTHQFIDKYYKRYGIMYKVMDIEYQLVDYLDIKKNISIEAARQAFSRWLKRQVTLDYTLKKIQKLQKEGWVKRQGNRVLFVKMFPAPHGEDYFDNFLLRWKKAPNAQYWDYLTREIIINYDYQMGEIYRGKIRELKEIRSMEKRPKIIADINKRIQDNWKKAMDHYEDALFYGHDSISILHNVSVVFMNNQMEDLSGRAKTLLQRALKLYPSSFGTYNIFFTLLIRDSLKHPENREANLKLADKYMDQIKHQFMRYKGSTKDYTKHRNWKQVAGIANYFKTLKKTDLKQLAAADAQIHKWIKSKPSAIPNNLVQNTIVIYYSLGFPFQYKPFLSKGDDLFNSMIQLKAKDAGFNRWAFNIALQTGKNNEAYMLGKRLLRLEPQKADFNFYYNIGAASLRTGQKSEAAVYFKKFLDLISKNRTAFLQQRNRIDQVNKLLKTLK